jgi:hypothetical protein
MLPYYRRPLMTSLAARALPSLASPLRGPSAVLPVMLLGMISLWAGAAAPPGHPSPADAYRIMKPDAAKAPAAPTRVGQVVSAIDANEYTYIEVTEAGRTHWIAGPKTKLSPGDTVRFSDGVLMTDFYSKLLQRNFPAVMFVSSVVVTPAGN